MKLIQKSMVKPVFSITLFHKIIFAGCISFLATVNGFAQDTLTTETEPVPTVPSPVPFNASVSRVEYKWNEGSFSHKLPFDKRFIIHVTDVPPEIDSFTMTFYEMKGNSKNFKAKNPITEKDILDSTRVNIYKTATWKRKAGYKGNSADVRYLNYLRPNCDFAIDIKAYERQIPSKEERDKIRTAIINSVPIKNLFKAYSKEFLESEKLNTLFLPDLQKSFNLEVVNEIKKLNNKYHFTPPTNELALLRPLAAIFSNLRNLNRQILALQKDSTIKADQKEALKLDEILQNGKHYLLIFSPQERAQLESNFKGENIKNLSEAHIKNADGIRKKISEISVAMSNIEAIIIDRIVIPNVYTIQTLGSNYPIAMTEQANLAIGLDLGAAYIANFQEIKTYYGLNIYFRPINKDIPLSHYRSFEDILATRTSLLFGVTFASVEKDGIRKGILGDKGLVIGAGFKITSFLRINGGTVTYYRSSTNPLLNEQTFKPKISPFVSFSFDLDLQSLLGVFGSSLFPVQK